MPTDTVRLPNVVIEGDLKVAGALPSTARTYLTQDNNARYAIPWTFWRIWDSLTTNLTTPGVSADDLGLIQGTFGTGSPSIQSGDLKNAGSTTRYARCQIFLPPEFVTLESVTVRAHAGMVTTVASTAATIDFEVYRSNSETGIGSDLCSTSATTINSLTFADKDFTITPTTLNPGDLLDIRMAILVNDTATGTAVIGCAGAVELLLDIKG